MTDIVVRGAQLADADRLFALVQQFATSYQSRRGAFDDALPRLLASAMAELRVAELAGEVVGYALAHVLLTFFANGTILELQELMVAPEHRHRGIGRRLVQDIVARAEQHGVVEVTVPTRRARDFYLRLGFEETATYLKRTLTIAASGAP